MNDLEYIKRFSKITITKACEMANVDRSNLWASRTSKEKVKKVKEIIQNELEKLNNGIEDDKK